MRTVYVGLWKKAARTAVFVLLACVWGSSKLGVRNSFPDILAFRLDTVATLEELDSSGQWRVSAATPPHSIYNAYITWALVPPT